MANSDPVSDFLRSLFGGRGPVSEDELLRGAVYRRVGVDPSRLYGKFAFRSDASVGSFPKSQEFDAVGDTLFLDELVGSEALYVKLGDQGNPWIRMEEGDELRRKFDKVWITTGAAPDSAIPGLTRVVTEATFLHSWGSLKRKGRKSYAFRRGFKAFRGIASTVEQSIFAPLAAIAPNAPLVFGKRGGTIIIRNRDGSNSLLLRHGVGGSPGSEDYWELFPGEALTLGLGGRIHSTTDTILVSTSTGTARFGFLVSGFDIDRADLDQTSLSGI